MGQKLIDIYEEEYKKSEFDKIIIACKEYNDSIDNLSNIRINFLIKNMKVNDTYIYDIDLVEWKTLTFIL